MSYITYGNSWALPSAPPRLQRRVHSVPLGPLANHIQTNVAAVLVFAPLGRCCNFDWVHGNPCTRDLRRHLASLLGLSIRYVAFVYSSVGITALLVGSPNIPNTTRFHPRVKWEYLVANVRIVRYVRPLVHKLPNPKTYNTFCRVW